MSGKSWVLTSPAMSEQTALKCILVNSYTWSATSLETLRQDSDCQLLEHSNSGTARKMAQKLMTFGGGFLVGKFPKFAEFPRGPGHPPSPGQFALFSSLLSKIAYLRRHWQFKHDYLHRLDFSLWLGSCTFAQEWPFRNSPNTAATLSLFPALESFRKLPASLWDKVGWLRRRWRLKPKQDYIRSRGRSLSDGTVHTYVLNLDVA